MEMAQIKALQSKPLFTEDAILADLRKGGWQGSVETLRKLAGMGAEWRQRNENEASYAWACNSPGYVARTERLGRDIVAVARGYGLHCYLQGDCRGAPVYVDTKPIPENSYSGAHCLYWLSED